MAETPNTIAVNVTPATPPASKVSPKVWASTLAALALSLVVAILTAVVNDPAALAAALDALPAWLRFIVVAALPTLVTFLAGYAKRDTTRELGQAVTDTLTHGTAPEPDVTGHDVAEDTDYEYETNGDPHAE